MPKATSWVWIWNFRNVHDVNAFYTWVFRYQLLKFWGAGRSVREHREEGIQQCSTLTRVWVYSLLTACHMNVSWSSALQPMWQPKEAPLKTKSPLMPNAMEILSSIHYSSSTRSDSQGYWTSWCRAENSMENVKACIHCWEYARTFLSKWCAQQNLLSRWPSHLKYVASGEIQKMGRHHWNFNCALGNTGVADPETRA